MDRLTSRKMKIWVEWGGCLRHFLHKKVNNPRKFTAVLVVLIPERRDLFIILLCLSSVAVL